MTSHALLGSWNAINNGWLRWISMDLIQESTLVIWPSCAVRVTVSLVSVERNQLCVPVSLSVGMLYSCGIF